jgi:hypothetical protein
MSRQPSLVITTTTRVQMVLVAYYLEGQIGATFAGETLEEACEAMVRYMQSTHVRPPDGGRSWTGAEFNASVAQLKGAEVADALRKEPDWQLPFCCDYSLHLLRVHVVRPQEE